MRTFTARHLVAVGLAAGALAGVGVARAAIPSPGGSISGCINPNTGALRVVDAQAGQGCSTFERAVTWNQEGQQGPRGNTGPAGPAGPAGPQGPAGPVAADDIRVSRRFGQGPLFTAVPGCRFVSGTGFDCGRLDAGTVNLPPGNWEVTAQILAGNSARYVFADNRREVTCSPDANLRQFAKDQVQVFMTDAQKENRASWTWIVTNNGPGNLAWNLGCVTSYPEFSSPTEATDTYLSSAVIIARPVASVTTS